MRRNGDVVLRLAGYRHLDAVAPPHYVPIAAVVEPLSIRRVGVDWMEWSQGGGNRNLYRTPATLQVFEGILVATRDHVDVGSDINLLSTDIDHVFNDGPLLFPA